MNPFKYIYELIEAIDAKRNVKAPLVISETDPMYEQFKQAQITFKQLTNQKKESNN